jgi:hypothetical protein
VSSPGLAHELPNVMAVWERMGALCETMEFPNYEQIKLSPEKK